MAELPVLVAAITFVMALSALPISAAIMTFFEPDDMVVSTEGEIWLEQFNQSIVMQVIG